MYDIRLLNWAPWAGRKQSPIGNWASDRCHRPSSIPGTSLAFAKSPGLDTEPPYSSSPRCQQLSTSERETWIQ